MPPKKQPAYLTSTQFAEAIGVHPCTVRKWDRSNVLKPHHRTPNGRRLYTESQVREYLREAASGS